MKCCRRFLCAAPSLCFHCVSRCDCFVASSHEFGENKQLDDESTIILPSLTIVLSRHLMNLMRISNFMTKAK